MLEAEREVLKELKRIHAAGQRARITALRRAHSPSREDRPPTGKKQRVEEDRAREAAKRAVLAAVRICALGGLPLPPWVARSFVEAYDVVAAGDAESWDDVFGCPFPKGTHRGRVRDHRRLSSAIAAKVRAWERSDKMLPLGLEEQTKEAVLDGAPPETPAPGELVEKADDLLGRAHATATLNDREALRRRVRLAAAARGKQVSAPRQDQIHETRDDAFFEALGKDADVLAEAGVDKVGKSTVVKLYSRGAGLPE